MYTFIFAIIFVGSSVLSNVLWEEDKKLENNHSSAKYDVFMNKKNVLEFANTHKHFAPVRLKSRINKMFCQNPSPIKNTIIREIPDQVEEYDTLTQSDIVRNQYSTLPYPAVSHKVLAQEKAHYDNNIWPVKAYGKIRPKPFSISFGVTLEAVNHFLFQGKNQFR